MAEAQELFGHETFGKGAGQLATAIIKRGRALGVILVLSTQPPGPRPTPHREGAGLLTGQAAGDVAPLTPAASLLDDLRTVFATAEVVKLSTERILELLAGLRPAVYGSWTPEALAAALRPHEVGPGQVWIDGANVRGYRVEQITEALGRRELAV